MVGKLGKVAEWEVLLGHYQVAGHCQEKKGLNEKVL